MTVISQLEALLTLDSTGFRTGIDQVNSGTGKLTNTMGV